MKVEKQREDICACIMTRGSPPSRKTSSFIRIKAETETISALEAGTEDVKGSLVRCKDKSYWTVWSVTAAGKNLRIK